MSKQAHAECVQRQSSPCRNVGAQPSRTTMLAAFAAVLALVASSLAVVTSARQDKPKIAGEVEKAAKPAEAKVKTPPPSPRQNGKPRRTAPPSRQQPALPQLEVTFKSDPPGAEIFLNRAGGEMQSLGKTDAAGKLTSRLPRGRHQITASRTGARIVRQQIDVKPDKTEFAFDLVLPTPVQKPDLAKTDEPVDAEPVASDVAAESEPAKSAVVPEDVIKRFLDVKDKGSVTEEEWKQTLELARLASEREPSHKQLVARAHFAEGQVAYVQGDHANALVSFNKAVLASPDYVPAHVALGNSYLATNQAAEAFRAYERAAELDRNLALAHMGMGDALSRQGRTREATSYYKRAKSLGQPLPANTNLATARDLKRRKRWAEAIKEFEEVIKAEPSAEIFVEIGDCYVELEQPISASKAYVKATELDPKAALAHFRYAELMFKLNEFGEALEAYESALALDTTGALVDRTRARERANESARKLGLKKGK